MLKQTFATAASLTVALTAIAGSAEAATVSGSVSFSGAASGMSKDINPLSDSITFKTFGVDTFDGSSFDGAGISSISTLFLSRVGATATYSYDAIQGFVQFTNGIVFNLDAGTLERTRTTKSALTTIKYDGFLSGTFVNASGSTLGLGSGGSTLSFHNSAPGSASYSFSITAVPEPLTILGTLTAAGLGLGLKKKFEQEEA